MIVLLEEIKKLKRLPPAIDETKKRISRSQKDIVDFKRQKKGRIVDEKIINLNSYLNVLNIRLEDLLNNFKASKQMIKLLEQQKYEMETLETVVRRKKVPPGVDKIISDFLNVKESTLSPNLRF